MRERERDRTKGENGGWEKREMKERKRGDEDEESKKNQ